MRRWIALGAATVATAAAVSLTLGGSASAATNKAEATLRDADGDRVGKVTFKKDGNHVRVRAEFVKNSNVTRGAFHGFHIHANDVDATGKGCKADEDNAASTWFLSADGHYTKSGQSHGTHAGDMPSVFVRSNGKAYLSFDTDKFKVKDVVGKAVMLHAGRDNYGNVPVGGATDQYTANDPAATEETAKTGNAGDRIACGVIKKD